MTARYHTFRPGVGTGSWAAPAGFWPGIGEIRAAVPTEAGTTPRSGLPPLKPYVYRGTGADTLTAFMDDEPAPAYGPGRARSQPCGTPAAYRRHYRHGEPPCEACSQAESLRRAMARERRKDER